MATDLKIFHVSVKYTTPDFTDPLNPTNSPSEDNDDLRDKVMTAISGAGLAADFDIVAVIPLAGRANSGSYEVWVQGT